MAETWEVVPGRDSIYIMGPGRDGMRPTICTIPAGPGQEKRARETAAKITAVNDLLAVCIRYVTDHQCAINCDGPYPDCICLFCVMSAAITKAKGE